METIVPFELINRLENIESKTNDLQKQLTRQLITMTTQESEKDKISLRLHYDEHDIADELLSRIESQIVQIRENLNTIEEIK